MKISVANTICVALLFASAGTTTLAWQAGADPIVEARSLAVGGKLEHAQRLLQTYLSAHPSSADAHFLLGYVFFRMEKAKESLAEFTAGAAYRRPDADDLKVVASDYVFLKDFADADKWFTAAVTERPLDADAWYLLGRTQYNEEEYAKAIKSFEQAVKLRPQYVEAENNLGLALGEANEKADAQKAFETAIEWQGDSPRDAQPFLNLGTLLAERGDNEKALPYLKKAVMLAGDNPKAHEELAKAYSLTGQLEPAQSELEMAVKLAPESVSLHYQLAQIYRKRGLKEQAQVQFEICNRLGSTHSSTETPNPPR
jgi:tetratricopeptide (TPR) repeat protein